MRILLAMLLALKPNLTTTALAPVAPAPYSERSALWLRNSVPSRSAKIWNSEPPEGLSRSSAPQSAQGLPSTAAAMPAWRRKPAKPPAARA